VINYCAANSTDLNCVKMCDKFRIFFVIFATNTIYMLLKFDLYFSFSLIVQACAHGSALMMFSFTAALKCDINCNCKAHGTRSAFFTPELMLPWCGDSHAHLGTDSSGARFIGTRFRRPCSIPSQEVTCTRL